MKGHEHTHGHSRAAKYYSMASVTCNNDATSFANAVLLEGGELHRGPNEAKQDGHDDEAPQPLHKLLYLHNHAGASKAHTDVLLVGGRYDLLPLGTCFCMGAMFYISSKIGLCCKLLLGDASWYGMLTEACNTALQQLSVRSQVYCHLCWPQSISQL